MSDTGRPKLTIRLHPEALRKLQERAERGSRGRRSGAAAYVRQLIYDHLGFDSGEHAAVEEEGGPAPPGR